jgi:hypothetical protein
MNLPFVLDVAISLVLTYLILSLLASEIQEILTTLLQWRAAHLKKSIEILLSGDLNRHSEQPPGRTTEETERVKVELSKVKSLVDTLYDDPLIENISQESREGIEAVLRRVVRAIVTLGRQSQVIFGRQNKITLTKGNEPSYIPSETFATTLLEKLHLSQFAHRLTALNLQILAEDEIISNIDECIRHTDLADNATVRTNLNNDLDGLKTIFTDICTAFRDKKATLLTSVYRLRDELDEYITKYDASSPNESAQSSSVPQKFTSRLTSLQKNVFYQKGSDYNNIDEVVRRLQPSLDQVLEIFVDDVKAVSDRYKTLDPQGDIFEAYKVIKADAKQISDRLPLSLQQSLAALERRAQINLSRVKDQAEVIEAELKQFKSEIQVWFDRSMERASGVYKRNARGIAFLIGFVIALILNADTFHIASRLAVDSTLRETLVQNAQLTTQCPVAPSGQAAPAQTPGAPAASPMPTISNPSASPINPLDCVRQQVNQSLPLPIGWSEANLAQQAQESPAWFAPFRKFLGWIVSALAISMGASFWFELLGKIINVRNAGKRPNSKSDNA